VDYNGMSLMQLMTLAFTETRHKERVTQCKSMWADYATELHTVGKRLSAKQVDLSMQWMDQAGITFGKRVTESVQSIYDKFNATPPVQPALDTLNTAIDTMKTEVDAAVQTYAAEYKQVPAPSGLTVHTMMNAEANKAAEEQAKQAIIAALKTLDTAYVAASDVLLQASAPEVKWVGPQASEGKAPSGAPTSAPNAPGGPAGTAPEAPPASEAPQENAEAPAGAPPGGAPPAGSPGLSGGPSAPPSMPTLPPGTSVPRLPLPPGLPQLPTMPPFIPPVSQIPTLPPRLPNGSAPTIPGITPRTGVPGTPLVPGMASLPLAATPGVTAPAPQPGTAPAMPASGAAAAKPVTPGGSAMPPPMMPPPASGTSGGGGPKPGTADKPHDNRKARPSKTVPGVPPKLRGRAGKLDGQFLTSPRVTRAVRNEEEVTSVQFLDEELWKVDDTAERRRLTAE
jgi:hypothetical protein